MYSIKRITKTENLGLLLTIVLILCVMSIAVRHFFTPFNLEVIATGFIQEAIMALGMTLVVIIGGIDLSVSSVLPFSAIVCGILLSSGQTIILSISIALLMSIFVGSVNAILINRFRMHPFIATLAIMVTFKGVNLILTSGRTIGDFPEEFYFLGQGKLVGLPVPLIVFLFLAFLLGVMLKHHKFFQKLYFIGGNQKAAKLSGINIVGYRFFAYVLCSFLAGLAGVIAASQYISASVGFGMNSELRVITAVVIGGASLRGGKGNIKGTCLGVLFLAIIYNALVMSSIQSYWQEIINGIMLIAAVLLDKLILSNRSRGVQTTNKGQQYAG